MFETGDIEGGFNALSTIYQNNKQHDEVNNLRFMLQAHIKPDIFLYDFETRQFDIYWQHYWAFWAYLKIDDETSAYNMIESNKVLFADNTNDILISEILFYIRMYKNNDDAIMLSEAKKLYDSFGKVVKEPIIPLVQAIDYMLSGQFNAVNVVPPTIPPNASFILKHFLLTEDNVTAQVKNEIEDVHNIEEEKSIKATKHENKIIGIDLGNSNSCVALMEGDEAIICASKLGQSNTPSVLAFLENGNYIVGDQAKRQAITNPENTLFSFISFLGLDYKDASEKISKYKYKIVENYDGKFHFEFFGKKYSPEEITALYLKELIKLAEGFLGHEAKDVVITVSNTFSIVQIKAIKTACTLAGLHCLRIIRKTVAVSIAYGIDKQDRDLKLAILDIGGGAFDFSVVELGDGIFEVKSSKGGDIGGDNFDKVIMDFIASEFKKEHNINLIDNSTAWMRLNEAVEIAKIELSSSPNSEINIPFIISDPTSHLIVNLSRKKLEQLSDQLFNEIIKYCKLGLKAAGIDTSEIDDVIVVGGSSRIPKLQEYVEKAFARKPNKSMNSEESAAKGAAIQGGVLTGEVKDVLLLPINSLQLGIEIIGGVMYQIVQSDTTIPTKQSITFYALPYNQKGSEHSFSNWESIVNLQEDDIICAASYNYTDIDTGEKKVSSDKFVVCIASKNKTSIELSILECKGPMEKGNRKIGSLKLDGIPDIAKGQHKVEIIFDIDANGVLSVSSKNKTTNIENKALMI